MSVWALWLLTVLAAAMTGSIRLFVTARCTPAPIAVTPRRRTISALSCGAPPATRWRCSTGATANGRRALTRCGGDRGALVVEQLLRAQAAEPDFWLLFALLKRDATDLVVQKATELGVAALLPVLTERCNAARMNPDGCTPSPSKRPSSANG